MAVHFKGPILGVDRVKSDGSSAVRGWFSNQPLGNEPDYFELFDDFENVDAYGSDLSANNIWTVVDDSGATVDNAADVKNGEVVLTSAATTENDGASIQSNEFVKWESGKRVWFECRLKCNDADQTDIFAGFATNFATNPEAVLSVDDYVAFKVADGSANILATADKTGAAAGVSTDTGADLVDDTYVVLSIYIDEGGAAHFYVDRKYKTTQSVATTPTVELAVAFMSLSGSASGTRATSIDYVKVVQER
jgi:hypothetical protein